MYNLNNAYPHCLHHLYLSLHFDRINHIFVFFFLIDKSCFSTLFNHEDMDEIRKHLPVCHVEAPGQHEEAKTLPSASVHCI